MGATGICNDIPILANINLIEYFRISKGNSFKKGGMKPKNMLRFYQWIQLYICLSVFQIYVCMYVCVCMCVLSKDGDCTQSKN